MKAKFQLLVSLSVITILCIDVLKAQGPVDGFFDKKGKASITLSYSYGNYDDFYVGGEKVEGVPVHNEIDQTIYSLYAKYGLTEKITLIASLPYIKAEGNGDEDPVNGTTEQSDFQDASVFVKWAPYVQELTKGSVTYFVALGGSVPLGYEPNGILSLGTGAPGLDGKLGLQYNNNSGFFGTLIAGYGLRGKADNNTPTGGEDFDAPNLANLVFKLGYAGKHFYVDGWLDGQTSLSGVDIMGEGFAGNFPETKVGFARVGANLYVPFTPVIGASAGFGSVIDGRNIGLTTYYTGGITLNL
ncbi:MAG: hypothetical protein WBG48_16670 [Pricia sp.]